MVLSCTLSPQYRRPIYVLRTILGINSKIRLVSAMQIHGVLCVVVNLYCIYIRFIGETARISLCNMVIVLYFKVSYRKAWENCVQTLWAEPRLQSLIPPLSQPARTKSVIFCSICCTLSLLWWYWRCLERTALGNHVQCQLLVGMCWLVLRARWLIRRTGEPPHMTEEE